MLKGLCAGMQADRQHYQAFDRLQGLLTAAAEELQDVPLYFKAHDLAHTLKTTPPPAHVLRSAIVNAGGAWPISSLGLSRLCRDGFRRLPAARADIEE